ncbi:helicase-related protein [Turicibacter sanguinis]|uniref:helicase-related protein n=1 Tax=Turicibacter sanguinis TaxID=154288 RepID=UPI0021D4EFB7|nr:helicase-related protein [Turicibacter sanguinis]MCU7192158.1 SNF2-related protein [Turicibacter sanguinis]
MITIRKNIYIVDNSDEEVSVKKYLKEWCKISKQFDIATGYFEIGSLLELEDCWEKVDKIRLLFGQEMTKRTKVVLQQGLRDILTKVNDSLEEEKLKNSYLIGVPAIVHAIRVGKIECRVYTKDKFHAKAYITHMKDDYFEGLSNILNISKGYALVGSSNFTKAGLNQNVELNVQIAENVEYLQNWFQKYWEESEDITEEILNVIENHAKEYTPHEVYIKSMLEYYNNLSMSVSDWEQQTSVIYPILSQYQKDGYNSLIHIAKKYNGAFLCDGVGLGKTFVGMMLIERFVKKERKNVVLIVPAATRISVWESTIKKYMPELLDGFFTFKIINHTDLHRPIFEHTLNMIAEQAECIIIDEAHHFRNRSSNRYKKLFDVMVRGNKKQLYLLTATPINNSFFDLQHLIELFTHRKEDFFKQPPLGINNLTGHFRKMEKQLIQLAGDTSADISDNSFETEQIFKHDNLVNELVVQRSRSYVKKSIMSTESGDILFPVRQAPIVVNYSLQKSYGKLIEHFIDSFYWYDEQKNKIRPILNLAVYCPYTEGYYEGDLSKIDDMKKGRQIQVVNLIRQLLLKRFESSPKAFEETCIRIFSRLIKFLKDYEIPEKEREINNFIRRKQKIIQYVYSVQESLGINFEDDDEIPSYVWDVEDEIQVSDFNLSIMIEDTINDLEILSVFIDDLMGLSSKNDDKINSLKNILLNDIRLKNKKVIIFTEYKTTAKYIFKELLESGFEKIYELDGQSNVDRKTIIESFSPYYNGVKPNEITNRIDILIATDVLAEGLNLQDANCLINYDLHWNPVRLMQRIGRIDRRRSKEIEEMIIGDETYITDDRANINYWNFLPPDELENLLSLYSKVSKKTLRISKTFGIEGKQLLKPDDEYEALRDFNQAYDGLESQEEQLFLEYQILNKEYPEIISKMAKAPSNIYSGKINLDCKGIFFCYKLPVKNEENEWTVSEGHCRWYIYDIEKDYIIENNYQIWKSITCTKEEQRNFNINQDEFIKIKQKITKHITKTYLRSVQAPLGVKPSLVAWMQLK